VHADEVLTAFLELESQMAVKEMAFQEKACFASVAGCTAKVLFTAVGGCKSASDYVIRQFQLIFGTAGQAAGAGSSLRHCLA
jgi:hypothetical protein